MLPNNSITGCDSQGSDAAGMGKPVLAITMSSSLALRNFFQTGIIAHLAHDFSLLVLASPSIGRTLKRLGYDRQGEIEIIDVGPEPFSWRLLRQLKKIWKMVVAHYHQVYFQAAIF